MFKDDDEGEFIRAQFGLDWERFADWFPLWEPLHDVVNWFNVPPLSEEGCYWVCAHLAEFFTEEQRTIGTVPVGELGESKISFTKLSLVPELKRIPLMTVYKIQSTPDLEKRFELIFAELRKVKANEYPETRPAPPAPKRTRPVAVPSPKKPISPARSRPAVRTVHPERKISRRHQESDVRSLIRLMAPYDFPDWVVKMVCFIRRHAMYHPGSREYIFCTMQRREAKKWGVSHMTARRYFAKLRALRIIWYRDPGSQANHRPILGIVKNSRDQRRRWAKRKLIERNSSKVVQFKRPRSTPPEKPERDFSSTPPAGENSPSSLPDPISDR